MPPKRDLFPYVMGAIAGLVLVALVVVVYVVYTLSAGVPTTSDGQAQINSAGSGTAGDSQGVPTTGVGQNGQNPPRMAVADFKALYDAPAQRPLIIDVRPKEAYDGGHIKGATSFPESDVDTRIGELPKDKLVVAYCQ